MIYTLQLSTKEKIQITEEEKVKFENNLDKNFIKIGEAIINPSFVVSIIVDKEASSQQNRVKMVQLPAPMKDVKSIKEFLKNNKPKFLKS